MTGVSSITVAELARTALAKLVSDVEALQEENRKLRSRPLPPGAGEGALTSRAAFSPGQCPSPDQILVRRIVCAYRASGANLDEDLQNSIWRHIFETHHLALDLELRGEDMDVAVESACAQLADPAENDLLYGVEGLTRAITQILREQGLELAGTSILSWLNALARAAGLDVTASGEEVDYTRLLQEIDIAWGSALQIANPFPNEYGLSTGRGILSEGAARAAYAAYRVHQCVADLGPLRVAEIGSGLGRLAQYARQLGVRDYVSIETPVMRLAQAYYLARTIGSDAISLEGESLLPRAVRIVAPQTAFAMEERYGLVVAFGSIGALPPTVARRYMEWASTRTGRLLSFDLPAESDNVEDALRGLPGLVSIQRHPTWSPTGHIERYVTFAPIAMTALDKRSSAADMLDVR